MATTTPNFGWSVPTSTDLVKDGATAIETLGDSIDASLLDLKGGTAGQVLAKNSGTDMDFIWVAAGGGLTWSLLNSGGTALNTTQEITVSSLSAKQMLIFVSGAAATGGSRTIEIRPNNDTTAANYANFGTQFLFGSAYDAANFKALANDFGSGFNRFRIGTQGLSASDTVSGSLHIDSTDSSSWKKVMGVGNSTPNSSDQTAFCYNGLFKATSPITSITIRCSAGTFSAGTLFIYGAN